MDTTEFWIAPLLLVPAVGLLLLSTSARFSRLHDEFHRLQKDGKPEPLQKLLVRARLLKNSLVALYSSIAMLAVSSLLGTAAYAFMPAVSWIAKSMMAMGVISLAYASILLVRESLHIFEIFRVEAEGRTVESGL